MSPRVDIYRWEHSKFCGCGRELEFVTTTTKRHDPETGERITRYAWRCPRFARSWRNGWVGGIGHKSQVANETGRVCLLEEVWM